LEKGNEMIRTKKFKYIVCIFAILAVGLILFLVFNPGYKSLNTLDYTGSDKYELPYTGDFDAIEMSFEGGSQATDEESKYKGPIAIYYLPRNSAVGKFITTKNLDVADTLAQAQTIAVVKGREIPVIGESSTVYHLYLFDKNMEFKYSIVAGTSYKEKIRDIIKRIAELNISPENPDSLGQYAEWKQKILDGSFVSMLEDIKEYPESLNLETNPGLISRKDAEDASMILKQASNDHSIENEDPKDYIRSDVNLMCHLVKPIEREPASVIFFVEQVGRKNIGTYQVSVTLWSPIYRISAIDPVTGSLIAWRDVYPEKGPDTLYDPTSAEDGEYYYDFDEWETFLDSFSQ
jgi:hypothetical protein